MSRVELFNIDQYESECFIESIILKVESDVFFPTNFMPEFSKKFELNWFEVKIIMDDLLEQNKIKMLSVKGKNFFVSPDLNVAFS